MKTKQKLKHLYTMQQCINWNISHACFSHIPSCLKSFFSIDFRCVKAIFLLKSLCCSRCCIHCLNHIREIRNHFLFVSISSSLSPAPPSFQCLFLWFLSLFSYGAWMSVFCINWKLNSKCAVLSNGWMNVFNCVKWAFSLFPSSCHLKGGLREMNDSRRRRKKK